MSPKWRYFLGTVTIVTIVGGTIYAIKKAKEAEKAEEGAISLAEAKEIVKAKKTEEAEELIEELEEDISTLDRTRRKHILNEEVAEARVNKIQAVKVDDYDEEYDDEFEEELDEDDPLRDDYPLITEEIEGPTYAVEPLKDFYYYEEGIDPKEDKELRYDPNSVDAKHQFIRMELADWDPTQDVYRILIRLFEFPFVPMNGGDEIMRTQIIDYKVQFFGFNSKWNKEVSYADVVLHYARTAEFECGESVAHWAEHFLWSVGFQWDTTSQEFDTMLLRLNSHTYFNEERQTFGLFGLTQQSMDQAIRIANMNIDRSVTYDIEFNEFLKSNV